MSEASPLKEAFKKAAEDPEARRDFYELLLKSTVFVPGFKAEETGEPKAEGDTGLKFKHWPQPDGSFALPFFADQEDLQKTLNDNEDFLALPTLTLFQVARNSGSTLVLVAAEHGSKAFTPEETEAILTAQASALDPLAEALAKAVMKNDDQAKREFYNALVNARVFVFGQPRNPEASGETEGPRPLSPKDQFIVATMAHPHLKDQRVIPFFSSQDFMRLAAQRAKMADPPYLDFSVMNLFQLAQSLGLPLVLNPGPTVYKLFRTDEIEFILTQVRRHPFRSRRSKRGGELFPCPPEIYPQDLAAALKDFLPSMPEVKAAYLAVLREAGPEAGREAGPAESILLGLELEKQGGLEDALVRLAPLISQSEAAARPPVDCIEILPGGKDASQFFLEKVEPFYRRSEPGPPGGAPEAEPDKPARGELPAEGKENGTGGLFGRLKKILKT